MSELYIKPNWYDVVINTATIKMNADGTWDFAEFTSASDLVAAANIKELL